MTATTEPDFRALCAELLGWADRTSAHFYVKPELLERIRAALAQPAPEPLIDLLPARATPNRPLWRVMKNTIYTHDRWSAMIRAIADWQVPEEPYGDVMGIESKDDWARIVMRDERQRLRALLLAEADRADAETLQRGMKMTPGQWEAGF